MPIDSEDDGMNPDEVVEIIKKMGISKISRRTLFRWEKEGLVPPAQRGNYGRGIGSFAKYPYITPSEFYASWHLVYGDHETRKDVAKAREIALNNKDISIYLKSDDFSEIELGRLAIKWLELSIAGWQIEKLVMGNDSLNEILELLTQQNEELKAENAALKKENAYLRQQIAEGSK